MNSVLIYPFGKESEYWIKFTNLLDNLQPVCLVALQGWDDRKVFIMIKRVFLFHLNLKKVL